MIGAIEVGSVGRVEVGVIGAIEVGVIGAIEMLFGEREREVASHPMGE